MDENKATESSDTDTVMAGLIQHIIHGARMAGLPHERLRAAAGLTPDMLTNPNDRVPARLLEQLVCSAADTSGDPLLGLHMSTIAEATGFGVLGLICQACTTLQEMIDMTIRYERLISDIGKTSLHYAPGIAIWSWTCKTQNKIFERHATEYLLGFKAHFMKLAPLAAIHFRHALPHPDLKAEYESVFGCPVLFEQPLSGMVFPLESFRQALANPDPALQQILELRARELLEQRRQPASLVERAREALRRLIQQGSASREALASRLGISPRHLHRQLDQQQSSYRELFDDLRMEIARQHLRVSNDSIETIALRLKFSESQSFIRWFRLHTGQTPGQYRKTCADAPAP